MSLAESFRAFADCLREPTLLVSREGEVVALNAAAAALFGAPSGGVGVNLGDLLHVGGTALDDFVRAAARTTRPVFAALQLRSPSGSPVPYRAEGRVYGTPAPGEGALVFLRLTPQHLAAAPLVALDERLRAYSRGRSGVARTVSVNELVSATAWLIAPLLGEAIEVVTHAGAKTPLVHLEPAQLERVLVNLAVRARDVMPEGGRLVLETGDRVIGLPSGEPHAFATITVRDSGPTPSPADVDRLFEPASSAAPGAGISLASCRAAVAALGGYIHAAPHPDGGTGITIMLPAVVGELHEPAASANDRATVLVVDDDDSVRDLMAESLQSAGFDVLSAVDGHAAVEVARAHPRGIDVLITDVVMPHVSGPRVAQAVRAHAPRVRVLYVSGYAERADLPADTPSGPSAFLAKPFTRGALVGRVRALLDR